MTDEGELTPTLPSDKRLARTPRADPLIRTLRAHLLPPGEKGLVRKADGSIWPRGGPSGMALARPSQNQKNRETQAAQFPARSAACEKACLSAKAWRIPTGLLVGEMAAA